VAAEGPERSPPEAVDPKRKETRWIGKIPYDVFYDRPLEIAADGTPIAGTPPMPAMAANAGTPTSPMPMPMTTAPEPMTAGATGGFDIGKLTSIEALVEESKQSRTKLTTGLQKLGDFNKNFKEVSSEAAILAVIAEAVNEHPEKSKANWNEKAKFIRDLSKEISGKASDKGSERFNAAKTAFDKICEMLDGGKASGEAADKVAFSDVTTLGDVMWRFQKTFDYLKLNINDAKRFKDEKGAVEREAMMFNLLSGVMGTEGYEYLDEDEYKQFHQKLMEGTAAMTAAITADDFDKFRGSLNTIQQAMDECHPKYRTGG
jgi:hypothetical protein